MPIDRPNRNDLVRFFSKVKVLPNGCWQWIGALSAGYGRFTPAEADRADGAHRIAYRWFVGEIPRFYQLDHLCCFKACVNPAHLEPVTPRVNVRRARGLPEHGANIEFMARAPTHPGEIFEEEYRKPSGISQAEAARRMRMSANRLNEIVVGKRGVTAESAILLGLLTRTHPSMWIQLQVEHDLWLALQKMRDVNVESIGTD